ncbi:YceD family protein [Paludibacterium paludis]|uniref:Large ribosomal RNA subunit accumulation protein YceD n=1 Tax=Paludibacterium paludis TaxID=1225769 RepID=A0A918U885_9NEIS|nr:YceD family protein [Paludibacterium paludis]GGY10478.1 hypothetical protein GCM10011289_11540 [Paludibacterium paludis]
MSNPILIDPLRYAREGRAQSGKFAVAALDARVLSDLADERGEVSWTLTGFVDALYRPCLRLVLEGEVTVACVRCLDNMAFRLETDSVITLFTDEAKMEAAVEADESLDAVLVAADEEFDVAALIEDEIIMGLPLSPSHGECGEEHLLRAKSDRLNPFAVLATLKGSKSE